MSLLTLLLFSLPLSIFTETLEKIRLNERHSLTCGQSVIHCEVKPGGPTCIGHDERAYVSAIDGYILLCQTQDNAWSLCLKILVNITVKGEPVDVEMTGDASGDEEAEELKEEGHGSAHQEGQDNMTSASTAVSVRVCYTYPSLSDSSVLQLTLPSASFNDATTLQLWMSLVVEIREADLGSPVVIYSLYTNSTKQIIIPTLPKHEVCSKGLDVHFCKGPRLNRITDYKAGVVKVFVADADKNRFRNVQMCQKMESEGDCLKVKWNVTRKEFEISLSSVTPCLCFEIWGNFPRKEYCPFFKDTAVSVSHVSVSVTETKTRNQSMDSDRTALLWTLTAPCRLEAELWLCRKGSGAASRCHQMNTTSHTHNRHNKRWIKTEHRHWQLQGEFLKVERHPSLCVQVKVKGMEGHLGPICPFEVKRAHWGVALLVCALLVCLSVLGAYAMQVTLKSWVFRWLKVDNMNSGVGRIEVVLLYPPNADSSITELVCRLSSSLSALGFSVSLDLWSRLELNALGPVPWLHSRLDQVQRHGGKAVLVLTPAACQKAQEWSCRGEGGKNEGQKQKEEEMWVKRGFHSLTGKDVFSASLSCILADYLLGRAGERFMLAQFEAQSHEPNGSVLPLPEFFQGLPLFSLPSQSLGFLMELTSRAHKGRTESGGMVGRWTRAGGLRRASRALSAALHGLTGSSSYTHAGTSQDGVESSTEDTWENSLLQPEQLTPPVTPALHSRTSTMSWV